MYVTKMAGLSVWYTVERGRGSLTVGPEDSVRF